MIVADSSVWISRLRNIDTIQTQKIDAAFAAKTRIIMGDIILMEILQGAQNDNHAANLHRKFIGLEIVRMFSPDLALEAATNYRKLRSAGINISKTADLIIGTFCITHGYKLVHADKHFLPMAEHLGLQLA